MTRNDAYTIRISTTGQPSITLDTITVHRALGNVAGFYRNHGGYDIEPADHGETLTLSEIADTLRATFADARVRRTSRRVKVTAPAALLDTFSDLEKAWEAMADDGMSHAAMRQVMINRDDFRAIADRVAA